MGEAEQPGMYPVRGMPAGMSEDGAYKAEPPGQVQMNLIEAAAGLLQPGCFIYLACITALL